MANKQRLVIAGIEFYVKTDEQESYMLQLAEHVNARVTSLTRSSQSLSTAMAALLCALQESDENHKLQEQINQMKLENHHSSEDLACATIEASSAAREIERLNRENMRLRTEVAELKASLSAKAAIASDDRHKENRKEHR